MPPRPDSSPTTGSPSLADKIDQLIAATTTASAETHNLLTTVNATATATADRTATHLTALLKAMENLTTKMSLQHDTTTMLTNHVQNLTNNLNTPNPNSTNTASSSTTSPPQPHLLGGQQYTNHGPIITSHTNTNQTPSPRPTVTISHPPQTPRAPKISLPLFDGTNPLDWIFQADNFFNYYQTPIAQRISLSVFYFTGDALSWYKHLATNEMLGTWATFKRELEIRFGPSSYENHEATLFKLRQTSTVTEYQAEFEKVSNRVNGLSQQTLRNCFISGLRRDIQNELALLKPISLHQAYGQARLVEEKLSQNSKQKFSFKTSSTLSASLPTSSAPSSSTLTTSPTTSPASITTAKQTPSLPITRLSPEAIQQRRKDGLCFRCPEKYYPGHKCSPPQFLLIVDNDDTDGLPVNLPPDDMDDQTQPQFLALSDAAFFGLSSSQTLRVTGTISGHPVTILVDCGSTHNILQPRIASLLHLPTEPIIPFSVMVGNGQHIGCTSVCPAVQLQVQKSQFTLPCFIIPVEGADVILGVAWLRTLGRLSADFAIPEITFTKDGKECTLTGDPLAQPVSPSSLSTLLRHKSIASLHTILYQPPPSSSTTSPQLLQEDPHITTLITAYPQLFEETHTLPPSRPHDHHIPLLDDSKPVNVKPYRYPHYQKKVMTNLIEEMLKDGIIRPSHIPFSSPVLLVKKKDGSWRFCVDYRALNAVTIRDRFPIPTIDELLDELHGATVFSKIDLRARYHQIRVAASDIHKTAFRTPDGHYEFLVMPFGLTNAPSTFQAAMNDLFRDVLRQFVLVFYDDILVYSKSMELHYTHLRFVFETLCKSNFHAKPSKCIFGVTTVSFLGHVISAAGVEPEADKIHAIQIWPQPSSLTTLRSFLGLTGYYRRFVPNYANIAAPLTDLLKNKSFTWTTEAHQAFISLKKHMERLITLALPDFTRDFDVTTDASGTAIGAVLSQGNRPICFFSKKLCPTMQNQSTYTKELFAITEAVKKWRQYLLGGKFHIYTDHHSLKHLLTQTIQTREQQKWLTKLMGYNFEVHFKPGKENIVADALSRIDQPTILSISHPTAPWLDEIRHYFRSSKDGKLLVQQIQSDPASFPHHLLRDGLVLIHNKIMVPPITNLRQLLLEEYHASVLGGHAGIQATYKRLAANFSWLGLKKDVVAFVKSCDTCQSTKTPNHKPYGLLQPLPIPDFPWDDISMDFITRLPPSRGKTDVWVIVDRLSKFAHFIALPRHYTAASLASVFMREIYRLHGLPKTIVSDRDPIFISRFWKELFKQVGTKLCHSSAYHPQSDGQTEVVNRCLESYLRAFVFNEPKAWERYLYLAEFSYNTAHHSSINMTPFKALYGKEANSIHEYTPGSNRMASIDLSLQEHDRVLATLKQSMLQAQQRMVQQANKKRKDKQFQIGDWVYLRLQDYRQQSVEGRSNHKLSKRFFGPYKILERIGKLAYRLELPSSSRIHPVFHVALLKKSFTSTPDTSSDLQGFGSDIDVSTLPEDILQIRMNNQGQKEVLVKWEHKPLEDSSWELLDNFLTDFPFFKAHIEGNVVFREGGDDMASPVPIAQEPTNPVDRPKRATKKPAKLRD
ncbi:hypothetical protein SSX86_010833 [Deinandra increscens subsp. villosa]|uniref:RNA-directed DNA polymerase n=1 Tax=Deinandra increscens subsp. villosa TaxID=3103831 RepID=A0AAP0D9P0_9ASTR